VKDHGLGYLTIARLLCVSLLLAGCATKHEEVPEVVQKEEKTPWHTVAGGDSVESIASKYSMTRKELIEVNELKPPYQLYDGQRLIVYPGRDQAARDGAIVSEAAVDDLPPADVDPAAEAEAKVEDPLAPEVIKKKHKYIWPIHSGRDKVTQRFNGDDGGIIMHTAVGTPVMTIADGAVVIAGIPSGEAAAYGKTVVIKHNGMMSIYANLRDICAKVGKKVKQGAVIGNSGKSGAIAKEPQLFFEMDDTSNGRKSVDPEKLLP
jgi:murein DD-endopeptidase MepM/ murein hydrolase activator NlpD